MSVATLNAIKEAIQAHIEAKDENDDAVLTDHVIGYSKASFTEDGLVGYSYGYIVSDNATPHSTLGLLQRTTWELETDLMTDPEDDEP
ncbi:hypothetical protein LWF01_02905 [Saxibacter everestensis]|uniref:Uncharacterized protein n=1 Tax=Saxibacter everestensis TaxID=2909229 RepID=A0ABY8QUY9_9MICO|nr:hypothetical protein LWF01_02905 [Brevibacteriaceae bacterium ZFBP1038]